MLRSVGLGDITGVTFSASKGQSELKAHACLFSKAWASQGAHMSMDAANRHLLGIRVTTVTYLLLAGKYLDVWSYFSDNQNYESTLQGSAGPEQIPSVSLIDKNSSLTLYTSHKSQLREIKGFSFEKSFSICFQERWGKRSFLSIAPPAMGCQQNRCLRGMKLFQGRQGRSFKIKPQLACHIQRLHLPPQNHQFILHV